MVAKMRLPIFFLAAALSALRPVCAADDAEAQPLNVSAEAPSSQPGIPLALYRSLRGQLDALFNAADRPEQDSAEALAWQAGMLAQLRRDASAHCAVLLRALSARQAVQRELAAQALVFASNNKLAVQPLCGVLREDSDARVRIAASAGLAQIGHAAAVEALIDGLSDADNTVRFNCIAALGKVRDERAVTPLVTVLRTENSALVRLQAVLALSKIQTDVNIGEMAELMGNEADDRVRMALAALIRVLSGTEDASAEQMPDTQDYRQRLLSISGDMRGLEQKLRADRHDETVQIEQSDVERKIGDLISELERSGRNDASSPKTSASDSRRSMGLDAERSKRSGVQSLTEKRSRSGGADDYRVNPQSVSAQREAWASLPQKERDELLQVYRPEVPLRWRKRLEAYFVSVAADEALRNGRPASGAKEKRPAIGNE